MLSTFRAALHRSRAARLKAALRPGGRLTLADRLERLAAQRPEATFLRFEGRTLSYGQWNEAANRVAHWALSEGLGPGSVVALLMVNRPEQLVVWAGLAKVGAVTALVDPELRGRGLRQALAASRAETVVVGAECLAALRSVEREAPGRWNALVLGEPGSATTTSSDGADDLDALLEAMPAEDLPRSARRGLQSGDDLFLVLAAGASGLPDPAPLSHLRFLGLGTTLAELAALRASDVVYCPLALHRVPGCLAAVAAALQSGASVVGRRRFAPDLLWPEVCREGATALVYEGELCRALLAQPADPQDREHGLRIALGSGLPAALWERFRERFAIRDIREFYASTEASLVLVNSAGRIGAVGRLPGRSLGGGLLIRYDPERGLHPRRADGSCIECGPGEVGELVRRIETPSPAGGRGAARPAVQARGRLLRDVLAAGDVYLRSGDLFQVDERGWLTFVDPVADVFCSDGVYVFPRAVEQVLASCPGVRMASVYGVVQPGRDTPVCMAALWLEAPSEFDDKAFYGHAAGSLPGGAVPRFLRLMPDLPLDAALRPRKGALQAEGCDPVSCPDPLLVRDERAGAYLPAGPEGFE